MSDRVWHKGPPPHVGWWLCTSSWWRWWNGQDWSHGVKAGSAPRAVQRGAAKPIPRLNHEAIEWCDYWPENARVPRLDPTGGHWTFNVDGEAPAGLPETIEIYFRNGQIRKWPFARELPATDWYLRGTYFDILAWRPAA